MRRRLLRSQQPVVASPDMVCVRSGVCRVGNGEHTMIVYGCPDCSPGMPCDRCSKAIKKPRLITWASLFLGVTWSVIRENEGRLRASLPGQVRGA